MLELNKDSFEIVHEAVMQIPFNMMMARISKKTLSPLFIIVLCLLLIGCNGESTTSSEENRLSETDVKEVTSWVSERFSLKYQFSSVALNNNVIVGSRIVESGLSIVYLDNQTGIIKNEIVLPDITDVKSLSIDDDGYVYVIGNSNSSDLILRLDSEGNRSDFGELVLDDIENALFIEPKNIYFDDNGNIYIWYSLSLPIVEIFTNDELESIYSKIEADFMTEQNVYLDISRIYVMDSGFTTIFYEQFISSQREKLLHFGFDKRGIPLIISRDAGGLYTQELNVKKRKMSDRIRLKNSLSFQFEEGNIFSSDIGFLFHENNYLYSYDIENQDYEKLLNLSSHGVTAADIVHLSMQSGIIAIVENYSNSQQLDYISIRKGQESKKVLTVGLMQSYSGLEKIIAGFNRISKNTRVEVINYCHEDQDFVAGVERLKLDIVRGAAPDIIDVSMFDHSMLMDKGVFVDLLSFMENDHEINVGMIVPSVLDAYKVGGFLYSISPGFQLYSMWGKSSIIGNEYGLTLKDLMVLLETNGKSINAIDGFSADESVLTTLSTFGMDEFIDWENATCVFDSEYFKSLLLFSKEYGGGHRGSSWSKRIRENEILLSVGIISSVVDYQIQAALFDDDLSFIGYPTKSGPGTSLSFRGSQIAINAKSEYQAEAWDFVKFYLKNGYSNNGFPVLTAHLEEVMEEAKFRKSTETVEGIFDIASGIYSDEDFFREIFEAEQKHIDAVYELINRAKNRFEYNVVILNIINEEASAFFSGQKDLDTTVDVIQNRVQLYLHEIR